MADWHIHSPSCAPAGFVGIVEGKADAHLIAAAPELYEALDVCHDRTTEAVASFGVLLEALRSKEGREEALKTYTLALDNSKASLDAARAALKKARGEET
jgi:hypothetical protein